MFTKKKFIIIGISILLVILIGIGSFLYYQSTKKPMGSSREANLKNMTYAEVVKLFVGRRIQFDDSCNSQPNRLEVINNTVVLLDNQSSQDHTIKAADNIYNLESKKYVQMKTSIEKIPKIITIECDAQKMSGRIIILK
jgi:septal ring-binding cell division protein DamX